MATNMGSILHDLTQDQPYQKASSPSSFQKDTNQDDQTQDDEIPNIEAVVSLSPNSSCSSQTSPVMIREPTNEINLHENSCTPKGLSIITETNSSLQDGFGLYFSPTDSASHFAFDHSDYISKDDYVDDDLDVMLAPESLAEYQQYVQEENEEQCAERKLRRALIQEELNILIRATEENDELDGHEFEPEAIEALGVAANRVAYLKKYYNVAKCENVYVPSVAFTIMDGSLLEEASKHYFGKSDEFLVSYAAGLGSTIMNLKRKEMPFIRLTPKSDALTESLELDEDDDKSDDGLEFLEHSQLASLVWGVSPKATASSTKGSGFTFDHDHFEQKRGLLNICEQRDIQNEQGASVIDDGGDAQCKAEQYNKSKDAQRTRFFTLVGISIVLCASAIAYVQYAPAKETMVNPVSDILPKEECTLETEIDSSIDSSNIKRPEKSLPGQNVEVTLPSSKQEKNIPSSKIPKQNRLETFEKIFEEEIIF